MSSENIQKDINNPEIKELISLKGINNYTPEEELKKNLGMNDLENNFSPIIKRKKSSSRSCITCIDNNKKIFYKTEINKGTEENFFRDNSMVNGLKNKIKDLNNELNKLRNNANVQNYNILEMNYKLKNKEINELKQENNFFRFNLEERKRNFGVNNKNYLNSNYNNNKYNSGKKIKNKELLKPLYEQVSLFELIFSLLF